MRFMGATITGTKLALAGVILVPFIAGMVTADIRRQPDTKYIDRVVEKPVEKTVTVETDRSKAKADKLMEVKLKDDQIFTLVGQSYGVVSEIFTAVGEYDTAQVNAKSKELGNIQTKLMPLMEERKQLVSTIPN